MTKIIKEFTVVDNEDELIMCAEISDGKTVKSYEWRLIDDSHIEVIQHLNRDKNGNFYTTRHVYEFEGENPRVLSERRWHTSEAEHADNLCTAIEDGIEEISKSTYPYYGKNLLRTARHYRKSVSFNYNPTAAAKMDELIIKLEKICNK